MGKKNNKDLAHYYTRGKFTPCYHDVMNSSAYRSLSFKARCLLLEMQKIEFPNRNGSIGLSEIAAAKLLGCAPNTASVAFDELLDRGFIERCFDGDYSRGIAAEYRITYLPYYGREPTDEWKKYKKN